MALNSWFSQDGVQVCTITVSLCCTEDRSQGSLPTGLHPQQRPSAYFPLRVSLYGQQDSHWSYMQIWTLGSQSLRRTGDCHIAQHGCREYWTARVWNILSLQESPTDSATVLWRLQILRLDEQDSLPTWLYISHAVSHVNFESLKTLCLKTSSEGLFLCRGMKNSSPAPHGLIALLLWSHLWILTLRDWLQRINISSCILLLPILLCLIPAR